MFEPDPQSVDRVAAFLDGFLDSFNMTRPGREADLGSEIAWTIIRGQDYSEQGGMMGRIAAQVQPDGSPWKPNSAEYAAEKARKYGWGEDATNLRTSQMLSATSLYGETTIEPQTVTLRYGTGEPPSTSHSPTGYISDADRTVTDIQKMQWAHEQGRAVYGLGEGDAEAVSAVCLRALSEMIEEANG